MVQAPSLNPHSLLTDMLCKKKVICFAYIKEASMRTLIDIPDDDFTLLQTVVKRLAIICAPGDYGLAGALPADHEP